MQDPEKPATKQLEVVEAEAAKPEPAAPEDDPEDEMEAGTPLVTSPAYPRSPSANYIVDLTSPEHAFCTSPALRVLLTPSPRPGTLDSR